MEELCRTYWFPLYVYVRRQTLTREDAEDLTQEFFSRLLEKNYLAKADRERGKFRTFLLASQIFPNLPGRAIAVNNTDYGQSGGHGFH